MDEKGVTICKSVFKNGENSTTKTQFTKKWIELINILEKISTNFIKRQ